MDIEITTEFIKLQQLLKFAGLCESGADAKDVIANRLVSVNGVLCTERGKKLRKGDVCEFDGEKITVL
jgi:ribosome-associated protein